MSKVGILLVNMGSPNFPEKKCVKAYLQEFLSDKNVLTMPRFARWLLVNYLIIPWRLNRITKAYQQIWENAESPLKTNTESIARKLELSTQIPVQIAMLYGTHSIKKAFQHLASQQVNHAIVCPLFPQEIHGILDSIREKCLVAQKHTSLSFEITSPFFDQIGYLNALKQKISCFLYKEHYDSILFSFHGLPYSALKGAGITCTNHQIHNTDCIAKYGSHVCKKCYKFQCFYSASWLAKELHIQHKSLITFQSRLSLTGKWLSPITKEVVNQLSMKNKRVLIITPSFTCDCLETLYELQIELKAKSKNVRIVSCLNDDTAFIDFLSNYLMKTSPNQK